MYQYPPPTSIAPIQVAAARTRKPQPAIQMTPTVRARTGGTTVSFVPSARPAASPATRTTPKGGSAAASGAGRTGGGAVTFGGLPIAARSGFSSGGAGMRRGRFSGGGQRPLTRSATAERKRAIATTSLLALPGWREKSRFAAITEATAAIAVGPLP